MRDDFSVNTLRELASRVGNCCSNPDCRRPTSGPTSLANGSINIGVAAHISAASSGGPRYDIQLTSAERSSAVNGIWLCQTCSSHVDRDPTKYTKELLLDWKATAEERAKARIESPELPTGRDEPILVTPSTTAEASWLAFSSRVTTFVGRDEEKRNLTGFLNSNPKFAWWLITGPAGVGKSRLALELCNDSKPTWYAGFLARTEDFDNWSRLRPSRPTLVVFDYVASRAADIGKMVLQLARSAAHLAKPVRVLLLERDQGSWWSQFLRSESQSESAEIMACQHDEPVTLPGLNRDELLELVQSISSSQEKQWSASRQRAFESRMRTLDALDRPLFAMIATADLSASPDAATDAALLRAVLSKEVSRRQHAVPAPEQLRRLENLMFLATLVGGLLPQRGGYDFLEQHEIAHLLPNLDLMDTQQYAELVGAGNDGSLAGLQPDILGERFVLDRVASPGPVDGAVRRILRAAWRLQPDDLCDFTVRAASDFPQDAGILVLCYLPLESSESRVRWGRLVADIVRVVKRSDSALGQGLLNALRTLADRHTEDSSLQTECARAEFYLGNILLFAEDNLPAASDQFEATIARAGPGSEMAVAATNNRGILHNYREDEAAAFADWTAVIETQGVPDESRACSFNNRADIFARRGEHHKAIADRSAVLALQDTSPDRRYIALMRRSSSYLECNKVDSALHDLANILATDDIAPEQKAEALVKRGTILTEHGELGEARADFNAALASEELFVGASEDARVGLAEVARLEHDFDSANGHLAEAMLSEDITGRTIVEALIVTARLLDDQGKTSDAEQLWKRIATDPRSSRRQREVAARSA